MRAVCGQEICIEICFEKVPSLPFFLKSQGRTPEGGPWAHLRPYFPRPLTLVMRTSVTSLRVSGALVGGGWYCVGVEPNRLCLRDEASELDPELPPTAFGSPSLSP